MRPQALGFFCGPGLHFLCLLEHQTIKKKKKKANCLRDLFGPNRAIVKDGLVGLSQFPPALLLMVFPRGLEGEALRVLGERGLDFLAGTGSGA